MSTFNDLQRVFADHPRRWREMAYVYPVISRRSAGLSIGINLSPGAACCFDCVYCSTERPPTPAVVRVDVSRLTDELMTLVTHHAALFDEPEFRATPPHYRRLNDLAFSGDGEPTASPDFPAAAAIAAEVRAKLGSPGLKIVVITNACYLDREPVRQTLARLGDHGGEVWAKLDAGTEPYHHTLHRSRYPLAHILDNILRTARERPIVIQSIFLCLHGQPPPPAEVQAYLDRLAWLRDAGAQITLVQAYTTARRTRESYVTPLPADALEEIAGRIRALGLPAATFP